MHKSFFFSNVRNKAYESLQTIGLFTLRQMFGALIRNEHFNLNERLF